MGFTCFRLLGYEGLEVINPEGGTEDAEAEAERGRWKKEVLLLSHYDAQLSYYLRQFPMLQTFFSKYLFH